ncbi:MAG: META domain-containing protein [Bacteroidetes bacterium]|nr:META domain-containing protein [Bacteroidota bacterium]
MSRKPSIKYALLGLLLVGISCAESNRKSTDDNLETAIIWVNSFKTDCHHQGQQLSCLQIQEGEVINEDKWETYFSVINDFDYVPGSLYKLKVSVQPLDPNRTVGQSDAVRYTLIEELERRTDERLRLNDLWVLQSLYGAAIPADLTKVPLIEFHLSNMTVLGNASCNNFSGTIDLLSEGSIQLSNIASTKMACKDLNVESDFFDALALSTFYKLDALQLELLDSTSQVLLSFKKVD